MSRLKDFCGRCLGGIDRWAMGALLLLSAAAHGDLDNPLTIRITEIDEVRGFVHVFVYRSEETWLESPVYTKRLEVENTRVSWTIPGVIDGKYAIYAYQDVNGNGEHDTWFLDIPSEPYAYSNNVRGLFGRPRWDEAKFFMAGEAREVLILMR